jgi:hypothetical protein
VENNMATKTEYRDPDGIKNPVFVTEDVPDTFRVVRLDDILDRRITIVQHHEVQMSNPGGNPDSDGNEPRQDPYDGRGYCTVPSQNRKVRDAAQELFGKELYIAHGANLSEKRRKAAMDKLGLDLSIVEEKDEEEPATDEAEPEVDAKPKGKGKENYVGLGSSSVSRSRRERRDNKELARRKAFGKLLCSMYDRAIRKEFWKSYFLNTEKEVPIFAS